MWAAPIWSSSSQVRSLKLLELAQIGTPPSKHPQQHSNATCSTAISHGLISGREAEWADDLSRSWYPLEWFGSTNYIYIYGGCFSWRAGGEPPSLHPIQVGLGGTKPLRFGSLVGQRPEASTEAPKPCLHPRGDCLTKLRTQLPGEVPGRKKTCKHTPITCTSDASPRHLLLMKR